eukprot:8151653-Alexandrium_andersonii.AAC.1
MQRYGKSEVDPDGETYHAVSIEAVDRAVKDPFFWAMVYVLSYVGELLRQFLIQLDGCMCHAALIKEYRDDPDYTLA